MPTIRVVTASKSGDHVINDMAVNIREPESSTLISIRQKLVIDAQQMHHCCLPIVNMDSITNDVPCVGTRFAILEAWFHASARHPDAEGASMVVASMFLFVVDVALAKNGSTKFATKDHKRVIQ